MSQRFIHHNHFKVQTGWDTRLQYFHLTIWNFHTGDPENDHIVWDDFYLYDFRSLTPQDIVRIIGEHDIPVPESLLYDLLDDRKNHVGNMRYVYA